MHVRCLIGGIIKNGSLHTRRCYYSAYILENGFHFERMNEPISKFVHKHLRDTNFNSGLVSISIFTRSTFLNNLPFYKYNKHPW